MLSILLFSYPLLSRSYNTVRGEIIALPFSHLGSFLPRTTFPSCVEFLPHYEIRRNHSQANHQRDSGFHQATSSSRLLSQF